MQGVQCKAVALKKFFGDDVGMGKREDEPARKTIQIQASVHSKFSTACDNRAVGRSMSDTASRLIEWFSRQPEYIQTAILADVDRGMEAAYADALAKLADELRREGEPVIGESGFDEPHNSGPPDASPNPKLPATEKASPHRSRSK